MLAATDGLVVVRGPAGTTPLTISGIEAQLSGNLDGTHGFAQADCRLLDAHGLLLTASGRLDLDVKRLLDAPQAAWPWLQKEPIVATVILDGRQLGELPPFVRPSDAHGILRLETSLRGTLAEPMLAAKVALGGFTWGDSEDVRPFDACGTLQYDPLARRVGLGAQAYVTAASGLACTGVRVAVARATGTLDAEALLLGERGFTGNAELGLEDLPLELVSPLAAAGMTGRVRGAIALDEQSERPALSARLKLDAVTVRSVPVGSGALTVNSDGRAVSATLALERGTGTLNAEAHGALGWDRAWPRLDAAQPWTLKAAIQDIDAALLSPVVGSVLADLSGRLDGNVALTFAPPAAKGQLGGPVSELTGQLSLKNGALQLAGLGMRLSNVKFDATAQRNGARTVIAVRGLSAASGAKYDNVAASADLYLDGLALSDARANVNLTLVPLMIEGVSQATLTGSAALELFPARDPIVVAISLHELTAELPRSSGRSVLAVDDNPDILVKQPLREPIRGEQGARCAGSWRSIWRIR